MAGQARNTTSESSGTTKGKMEEEKSERKKRSRKSSANKDIATAAMRTETGNNTICLAKDSWNKPKKLKNSVPPFFNQISVGAFKQLDEPEEILVFDYKTTSQKFAQLQRLRPEITEELLPQYLDCLKILKTASYPLHDGEESKLVFYKLLGLLDQAQSAHIVKALKRLIITYAGLTKADQTILEILGSDATLTDGAPTWIQSFFPFKDATARPKKIEALRGQVKKIFIPLGDADGDAVDTYANTNTIRPLGEADGDAVDTYANTSIRPPKSNNYVFPVEQESVGKRYAPKAIVIHRQSKDDSYVIRQLPQGRSYQGTLSEEVSLAEKRVKQLTNLTTMLAGKINELVLSAVSRYVERMKRQGEILEEIQGNVESVQQKARSKILRVLELTSGRLIKNAGYPENLEQDSLGNLKNYVHANDEFTKALKKKLQQEESSSYDSLYLSSSFMNSDSDGDCISDCEPFLRCLSDGYDLLLPAKKCPDIAEVLGKLRGLGIGLEIESDEEDDEVEKEKKSVVKGIIDPKHRIDTSSHRFEGDEQEPEPLHETSKKNVQDVTERDANHFLEGKVTMRIVLTSEDRAKDNAMHTHDGVRPYGQRVTDTPGNLKIQLRMRVVPERAATSEESRDGDESSDLYSSSSCYTDSETDDIESFCAESFEQENETFEASEMPVVLPEASEESGTLPEAVLTESERRDQSVQVNAEDEGLAHDMSEASDEDSEFEAEKGDRRTDDQKGDCTWTDHRQTENYCAESAENYSGFAAQSTDSDCLQTDGHTDGLMSGSDFEQQPSLNAVSDFDSFAEEGACAQETLLSSTPPLSVPVQASSPGNSCLDFSSYPEYTDTYDFMTMRIDEEDYRFLNTEAAREEHGTSLPGSMLSDLPEYDSSSLLGACGGEGSGSVCEGDAHHYEEEHELLSMNSAPLSHPEDVSYSHSHLTSYFTPQDSTQSTHAPYCQSSPHSHQHENPAGSYPLSFPQPVSAQLMTLTSAAPSATAFHPQQQHYIQSDSPCLPAATATQSSPSPAVVQLPPIVVHAAGSLPPWVRPRTRLSLDHAHDREFSDLRDRRATYEAAHWDFNHSGLDAANMALAGFFISDSDQGPSPRRVRCFYCGLELRDLWEGANIWEEHVRHNPHCAYLRAVKGEEGIREIQRRQNRKN